jgi:AAA domain/Bifunctional DNA primase/polymerase, N-terminal/Primase C terminal 1 (PriCT-1)
MPGLDFRGNGGYVVVPPSVHATKKIYKWYEPIRVGNLRPIPEDLEKLLQSSARAWPSDGVRERFNTAKALHGVPEGQRDETLWKLACKVRNADVPREIAETLILEAARNCEPPFSERIALDKVARAYQRYQPKHKESEFRLQFMSMKELLALPPDPTRWLWDQTLPAAGTSVLVAKPKIGKSTFAAKLGMAVARGLPFLGRNTQQSPVAYLSLDASLPEMIETFQPFRPTPADPIFIHAGAAPNEAVAEIMQWVKENDARLVIVDTMQRLFRFQNVNDYSEVTNAIEPLTEAAREQKIHVMFLHHAKKDVGDDLDSAIGSTAIRGLAYSYIHLKRLPDSERRILRNDQRGGKNISEMAIGFDRATGWLEIKGTIEEAEIEETEPKILEFLQVQETGATEKDILGALNVRAVIVSKALRQLFKNNQAGRTGKGRKGDPFRYSMANSLDSLPEDGGMGEETTGRESEKQQKSLANTEKILFPKGREEHGKSTEENPRTGTTGRESEEWEYVSR